MVIFFQRCWCHQKSISGLWNLHQSHDQGHDHAWIWDFWGGFTLQKLKFERKFFLIKKQVLQDRSPFSKIAWTCTLQIKESPFLGILHYILGNKQQLKEVTRRAVKAIRYFNILPSQHFNVRSTLFQRCRNETKSDVGFSTLHNVDTTSVPDVETTLNKRYTTSKQRCTTLVQRWYNVVST